MSLSVVFPVACSTNVFSPPYTLLPAKSISFFSGAAGRAHLRFVQRGGEERKLRFFRFLLRYRGGMRKAGPVLAWTRMGTPICPIVRRIPAGRGTDRCGAQGTAYPHRTNRSLHPLSKERFPDICHILRGSGGPIGQIGVFFQCAQNGDAPPPGALPPSLFSCACGAFVL